MSRVESCRRGATVHGAGELPGEEGVTAIDPLCDDRD
jgi:hypothetical protein